jgi:hypothetical protein
MLHNTSSTSHTSLNLYSPFQPQKVIDNPFFRFAEEVRFNGCCRGYDIELHELVDGAANENKPLSKTPRSVSVTFFPDQWAKSKQVRTLMLAELGDLILKTSAKSKDGLPWLKFAVFGEERTEKNCLRHNDNVLTISGIELDYDAKQITFDQAVAVANRAGLAALLYTSASYTDTAPKWRILLPTSQPLPPSERAKLVARVNGLYGGAFSPESFTLSQSFYFGSVNNNPAHRVRVLKGDCIDRRGDLDVRAIGKGNRDTSPDEASWMDNPFAQVAREQSTIPPASLAKVRAAMAAIPNDENVDRAQWIRIGLALRREYPGEEGLKLFLEWSQSWTGDPQTGAKYNEAKTITAWKSFNPHSIGVGTLFRLANEASPGWWERAQAIPLDVFDAGDDVEPPPPRGWLLGNSFARKFMSTIFADGGIGKTALRYAQLVALASGQPITGEHVFQRCRVLIVSLEDDRDELRRRILAVLKHHRIERSEVKGWLFYVTPGANAGRLLEMDKAGRMVLGQLAATIETIVAARDIDIVSIDPFVKSHSVEENTNSAIDKVVQVLTDLSYKYNIAVDAPHHISKGPADPGNADRGRGASAMKDAGRLVYTLTRMNETEAEAFGIREEERPLFIRVDSGKVNIARPATQATWFRLVGIPLDNGNTLYPNGDEVQTVEPWVPPNAWADMDNNLLNRILTAIDAGLPDGNRYTDRSNADAREAWNVVIKHAPQKTEAQAKEMIKTWVRMEVLVSRPYTNPKTRKEVFGLHLDSKMRPK